MNELSLRVDQVVTAVSQVTGVPEAEILGESKFREVADARHLCWYFIRRFCGPRARLGTFGPQSTIVGSKTGLMKILSRPELGEASRRIEPLLYRECVRNVRHLTAEAGRIERTLASKAGS